MELHIRPLGELTLIELSGDIEKGDADLFAERTTKVSKAVVALRSDGGSLIAGIGMGELVRSKGFATLVPANARCASACALVWLGGTRRYMSPEARIGFHAAYDGNGNETGIGNAILGAYVNKLGLSYSAVIYITQASPTSMTWLTAEEAKKNEIDLTLTEPTSTTSSNSESESAPSASAVTLRDKVGEFITTLFALWSSPNEKVTSILPRLYGSRVLFYGREVSDNEVLTDKINSMNRWPQRLYKVRQGSLTMQCDASIGGCKASGIVDWVVRSPARNVQGGGSSTFEYMIAMRDGPLRIVAESGNVISKLPTSTLR
ncbi:hypothetical protein [Bradyrhizobium yuanmingense]|uniref:COG3904 family protein n=1 Tax=Bradyrhizobium yuanmingense TaxID=108015 RepID=UPI003513EF8D